MPAVGAAFSVSFPAGYWGLDWAAVTLWAAARCCGWAWMCFHSEWREGERPLYTTDTHSSLLLHARPPQLLTGVSAQVSI